MFHILSGFVVSIVPAVPYGGRNSAKTLFGMASLKLTVFIDFPHLDTRNRCHQSFSSSDVDITK